MIFEQSKKIEKNDFEKKKIHSFFLLFIFIFFTLRYSFTINLNNFVFWNLIKNSDYDVWIISINVFNIFSLIIQKNKKKKRSRNWFTIKLFLIFLRFFSSQIKIENKFIYKSKFIKFFFNLYTSKKKIMKT